MKSSGSSFLGRCSIIFFVLFGLERHLPKKRKDVQGFPDNTPYWGDYEEKIRIINS